MLRVTPLLLLGSTPSLAQREPVPETFNIRIESFAPPVQEQFREALAEVGKAPENAEALGRVAMLLHAYEDLESAESWYLRARLQQPEEPKWGYYLGQVRSALGRHEEAVADLREALRLAGPTFFLEIRLADSLLQAGRLDESARLFDSLRDRQPDSPLVHFGLGRIEAALGNPGAAVEHLERACRLFPGFGPAHYALGLAYRDLGDRDQAQRHLSLYQQDRFHTPTLPDPWTDQVQELNIAGIHILKNAVDLQSAGQIEESISEHLRALESDAQLVQAHVNLIVLYAESGRPEQAEKHYQAALRVNPRLPEAHYNYGVLMVRLDRLEEAQTAFLRALEIDPHHAGSLNNLGNLAEQNGDLETASRLYRSAIQSQPGYALAHFNLGRILLHNGKHSDALFHFHQAVQGPESRETPGYLYALAIAYARAGERERAVEYARKARDAATERKQDELLRMIERDLRVLEGTEPAP